MVRFPWRLMTINRWFIALAGVLMQVALGAVYAWSVFRNPLIKAHGWTIPEVTLTFQITILVLGFAAFAGGLWMKRAGPRPVALTAAILYGAGTALAGLAQSLPMLYLTYGFVAGVGLGFGYIVPVATLIKWFPDKRGMITGIAVAGFGAGALITAPLATRLIDVHRRGAYLRSAGARLPDHRPGLCARHAKPARRLRASRLSAGRRQQVLVWRELHTLLRRCEPGNGMRCGSPSS